MQLSITTQAVQKSHPVLRVGLHISDLHIWSNFGRQNHESYNGEIWYAESSKILDTKSRTGNVKIKSEDPDQTASVKAL